MANHESAKKRSRQNKTRNTVNSQHLSKFRNALNKLSQLIFIIKLLIILKFWAIKCRSTILDNLFNLISTNFHSLFIIYSKI